MLVCCSLHVGAGKYEYIYLEAVRQMDMSHYDKAHELFRRCYELRPDAAEVNFSLGMLNYAVGLDSIGLSFLERATALAPENTEFAERLAQTYLYRSDVESATKVYEDLVARMPDRSDILELLVRIYEQQHDYDNLLKTLDRLELQEGQSEDITLSKMQAYSFMGNQQGAYDELRSLIDKHPYDLNLQVMMGNWLFTNGRKDEALKAFLDVLKEEPSNLQGQTSLMDFYRATGKEEQADSLMNNIIDNPRTDDDTRVSLMYQWMKTAPEDSIRGALEKILAIKPEDIRARLSLIEILWRDTVDTNVVRECKKAVEYVPNEPALYYYLGLAQHLNNMDDDAITTLRLGAANITESTKAEMSANIYVMLGDILHKKDMKEEAYNAYDSCLVYDPDRMMCLNNYAYFLSVDGRELEKAEKMSHKTIMAEPTNGTYLDTYAWILYQEGRYEEAKMYIDMALKAMEQEIADLKKEAEAAGESLNPEYLEIDDEIKQHLEAIEKKLNENKDTK